MTTASPPPPALPPHNHLGLTLRRAARHPSQKHWKNSTLRSAKHKSLEARSLPEPPDQFPRFTPDTGAPGASPPSGPQHRWERVPAKARPQCSSHQSHAGRGCVLLTRCCRLSTSHGLASPPPPGAHLPSPCTHRTPHPQPRRPWNNPGSLTCAGWAHPS